MGSRTVERDATAAGLLAAGVVALGVSAFAIFIGILLGSDEPLAAKPWLIGGFIAGILGLGLCITGLVMLVDAVMRGRGARRR